MRRLALWVRRHRSGNRVELAVNVDAEGRKTAGRTERKMNPRSL
jgi:hypothetical protein